MKWLEKIGETMKGLFSAGLAGQFRQMESALTPTSEAGLQLRFQLIYPGEMKWMH